MYAEDARKEWGNYQGSGQKPSDFATFWEKGKLEVDQLANTYELVPHEIYSELVEAFDMYFTGVGGAKIHAQVVQPKKFSGTLPVMFLFHGYHGSAGDWSDKVGQAAEGYLVVALDVRGQGGQSEDVQKTAGGTLKGHIIRGVEEGPANLFFRSVFLDIYQITQLVKKMTIANEDQMYTYGASQGGAQAIVCAAMEPTIKKAFVLYPFLSDYREAFRLNVNQSAYEELAYWFRFRDPEHKNEEAFFSALDYIDIQYFAPEIKAEVVWGMGLEDQVCHPKTQFAVYNQITSSKKLFIYPEYGHEYIPGFGDRMRKELFMEEE